MPPKYLTEQFPTLLTRIMGAAPSADRSVPPGGSTLVLMDPRDCIETKPKITSKQKPSCLSMLGDAQWNEWMGKLQHYVNQYFHELLPFVFLPIAFLAIGGTLAAHAAGVDIMHYGAGVFLLAFFGILVGRLIISSKNQGWEQESESMCLFPRDIMYHTCAPFSFKNMLE